MPKVIFVSTKPYYYILFDCIFYVKLKYDMFMLKSQVDFLKEELTQITEVFN